MLLSIAVAACGGGGAGGGGTATPNSANAISATATTTAQSLNVGTAMTSFSALTPSGGATPYTYSYTGTLPAGLSFSASNGAVTGTPTVAPSTASLMFSVKDANNVVASTTSTVSFAVATGLPVGYVVQGGKSWMPLTFLDTWPNANSYCTNTTINGQTGWRLPVQNELSDLYISGVMNGQGWTLGYTWSSTISCAGRNIAGHYCFVDLVSGFVFTDHNSTAHYVSCVR